MTKSEKYEIIADKWDRIIAGSVKQGAESRDLAKINSFIEGMSYRQMEILVILECMELNTVTEMAAFLKISKSTLSIIINKLVDKGYVFKEYPKGGADGRRVYFKISRKGRSVLAKIDALFMKRLSGVYGFFNDRERALFREGIDCLKRVNYNEHLLKVIQYKANADEMRKIAADIGYFLMTCKLYKTENIPEIPFRLTKNQFHLLVCISVLGMNTITKLEKHLGSSGSTLSIGVSKLVKMGYLRKEYPENGQDGRMVIIKITDKGTEVMEEAKIRLRKSFADYIESLDEEGRYYMERACDCLIEVFEKNDGA